MNNTIKKWHWIIGIIGAIIVALITLSFLFHGGSEGSVSTLYIIPAGTFSLFHGANNQTECYFVACYPVYPIPRELPPATHASSISPDTITQDPGSRCNPQVADSRIPVPVNISNAIRDPIPGIRYSLNESESGRTIVLGTGEIVEINLRWVPGVAWNWIIPVSGCGLELVQSGVYSDGGDFWNVTGHYRVRYRAVSPGTSFLDGTFGGTSGGMAKGMPTFNLTVIVK